LLQGGAHLRECRFVAVVHGRDSDLHDLGDLGEAEVAPNPQDNDFAVLGAKPAQRFLGRLGIDQGVVV
jgi:hypothetical protein